MIFPNKRNGCICVIFVIVILSFFLVSCKSNSYIDLLTGGRIRYWQFLEHKDYYMSFEKRTRRILEYDANLKVKYGSCMEILSKGRYFKISGNRITTYWKYKGYKTPADTFDILEANDQELVLKWTFGVRPAILVIYNKNER